jgi:4'-phosphopantetheinyl transferase
MDPAGVELQSSEQGKLRVAERQGSQIRFNLSHSKGFAIFAITRGREVGIDIEQVDGTRAWRDVAKVFFTGCEREVISRLPADRQIEMFFEIWTRKESILKALGMGLQFDPAHIDVAGNDSLGREITLRHEERPWKLLSLSADGFAATLAAPSDGWHVQQHHWPVE